MHSSAAAARTDLPSPVFSATSARRTWLSLPLLSVFSGGVAWAQPSGGGMGGGRPPGGAGGGSEGGASCAAAEPVSSSLIKIYAGERLRVLPAELKLTPEQLPLFERYAQALQQLMLDDSKWAARSPALQTSPMARVGAQIDLASNRAAAWEEVLDAIKPLYSRLDKAQQAVADQRLVVSLEPSAWALPASPRPGAGGKPPEGLPPKAS
ncbi:Spy/CpxP family protein refolding chaperone [Rhodoferax sp.]|uniref:Spy/CpxP family protein refolding chaperone n=1 Tax=Rhodoferax sp. TaxID=50421 RepID=UPI00374D5375